MKRVLITVGIIFPLLILGTIAAILYGRGYRLNSDDPAGKLIAGTGILHVTSIPDGARVYVDGKLKTATDNTINLKPGEYQIKIEKDGYFPWEKRVSIAEQVVTQAPAALYPIAPKLESLTFTGVNNPVIDPTGELIAYTVSSASAAKNGIYTFSMRTRPIIPSGGSASQIAKDTNGDYSSASLFFSPNGKDLIASASSGLSSQYYLFTDDGYKTGPTNITGSLPLYEEEWESQQQIKRNQSISSLPKKLRPFATTNFTDIEISPEENKILYTATGSAFIPPIKKKVLGGNTTPETRGLQDGSVYVYDLKDDRNYLLWEKKGDAANPKFTWHPDSGHLMYVEGNTINMIEYDGRNKTTIYAGPFAKNFVYPWPDGSNIVILTNFNVPGAPENLYRISLK